jgi:hypothetical protein
MLELPAHKLLITDPFGVRSGWVNHETDGFAFYPAKSAKADNSWMAKCIL